MFYVVGHLSLDDVRNLSLSSRRLQYLVQEPRITKSILEVRVKELTRRRCRCRWDEAGNGNNPLRWTSQIYPRLFPPSSQDHCQPGLSADARCGLGQSKREPRSAESPS